MSETSPVTPTSTPSEFLSYEALRQAHTELLRKHRQLADPAAIQAFLARAQATGAHLGDEEERQSAQSLLDYWSTSLFRLGQDAVPRILAEFDPTTAPELPESLCPYRGLAAFSESDAANFFGRQKFTESLVEQVRTSRLIGVMGPSGSGKSSVVHAGLIPRLIAGAVSGSQEWSYLPSMVPGSKPLYNLARLLRPEGAGPEWDMPQSIAFQSNPGELTRLVNARFNHPLVLVVDQFEEAFTLCQDDAARLAFVANLVELVKSQPHRHTVILTMRTDFEAKLALLGDFEAMVENNIQRVPPLNAGELRQAIEEPARRVGLKFEAGVVDALINDILGEPAALPLLQFTLLKLWEGRKRNLVTWDSFKRLGGARQALATSADDFYRSLIPEEQSAAREILLRLVQPGEGLEMTSRRLRREDLYTGNFARERVDRVLQRFLDERLLRLTHGDRPEDDQVEVAHEALVRNWPTLAEWYQEELETIKERRRLTLAADNWERLNHDPAALLRGRMLENARRYTDLTQTERIYLDASFDAEQAALLRDRRRQQALTAISVIASLAAIFAIFASIIANRAANEANQALITATYAQGVAQQQASTATSALGLVNSQAEELRIALADASQNEAYALSQQGTATAALGQYRAQATAAYQAMQYASQQDLVAQSLTIAKSQLDLGLLLSLEAVKQPSATQAGSNPVNSLLDVLTTNPRLITYLRGDAGPVYSLAFDPAGQDLYAGTETGDIQRWDTHSYTMDYHSTSLLTGPVFSMAASRDFVAYAGCREFDEKTAQCKLGMINAVGFPLDTPSSTFGGVAHSGAVTSLALVPDQDLLVSASVDSMIIWKFSSLQMLNTLPGTGAIAVSPDGATLASANGSSILVESLRSLAGGVSREQATIIQELSGLHTSPITALAFNSNGTLLASGSQDNTIVIWDLTGISGPIRLEHHNFTINSLAFDPNGRYLASASGDGTIALWNLLAKGGPNVLEVLTGHTDAVLSVAFRPDGKQLASAGRDGAIILWNMQEPQVIGKSFLTPEASDSSVAVLAFPQGGDILTVIRRDQTQVNWDIQPVLSGEQPVLTMVGDTTLLPQNNQAVFITPQGKIALLIPVEILGAILGPKERSLDWSVFQPAGVSFIYDILSEGLTPNPSFARQWRGIKDLGLLGGVIVTYQPGLTADDYIVTIDSQLTSTGSRANFHLGYAPQAGIPSLQQGFELGLDLPVAVRLDEQKYRDAQTVLQELSNILTVFDEYYGPTPLIYTTSSAWNQLTSQNPEQVRFAIKTEDLAALYPLFVSDYNSLLSPALPSGWTDWAFWEYTESEFSPDLGEPILPVIRFNGSDDLLRNYAQLLSKGEPVPLGRVANLTDLETGSNLGNPFHYNPGTAAELSQDGKKIWFGAPGPIAAIFSIDIPSGKESPPFPTSQNGHINSLAFSPDGRILAVGSDDTTVVLVNLKDMQPYRMLTGHTAPVLALAFSPDGKHLASGGADSTILLWDLSQETVTGKPLYGHRSAVTALTFHPSGRFLLSGSDDGNVVFWNIDPQDWQKLACQRAGRNLTQAEFAQFFPNQDYHTTCPQYPPGK